MHKKLVHRGVQERRRFKVRLGDWSSDGHGWDRTYTVMISGSDVSDEALQESYDKSCQEFGINIMEELFEDYGDNTIDSDLMQRFVDAGFDPSSGSDYDVFNFELEGYDYDQSSAVGLFVWFTGRNIPNFGWHEVTDNDPYLVGGYDTVLKGSKHDVSSSFGYGLFMN
mgnify:CR=1 FL=1